MRDLMGKNYKKELDNLEFVYDAAMKANIDPLANFLAKYRTCPFFGIGSGGSYSAASAFEFFCIKSGILAQKLTPLELGQFQYQLAVSAVILFTAGGSNNDSKNAYRYISELEPEGLLTCCMKKNAPIKRTQRENVHNYYYEYKMPVSKDGYLAVESLMSFIVLFIRAFYKMTGNKYFLLPESREWKNHNQDMELFKRVIEKETIFVLHGGITTTAAIDLESKFSEVSLGNTQLVDFRNFAHGRHYWISDRRMTTSIIALVGKTEKALADKTLKLLPKDIPVIRIDVEDDRAEGLIEVIYFGFQIVGLAAQLKNIDPGKPHVEDFGRKLYHLNYDIGKNRDMVYRRKDMFSAAAYRKAARYQGMGLDEYLTNSGFYWNQLINHTYRGIIFDYDGTLHNKYNASKVEDEIFVKVNELLDNHIIIGIATGRGKSVRKELQTKIERRHWEKVIIAYYNGGTIGSLADNTKPDKQAVGLPEEFKAVIKKFPACCLEENPYQLTLMKDELNMTSIEFDHFKKQIVEIENIRVMETNHSIDIIPVTSRKTNIFSAWEFPEEEFLLIGDSGEFGGNDYEMLCGKNSLSVDYVSEALDSCWNYAKPGMRNLEAAKYYLDKIQIQQDGKFSLKG